MVVRCENGSSRIAPWPTEWDPDMELYMAATTRMAKLLSGVLQKGEEEGSDLPRLKQWNVTLQQSLAIPPQLLPPNEIITPIVEFIPMEGQIGRIIIRLQGLTSRTWMDDNEDYLEEPVSWTFDGVFDTKQDMRPNNFIW